METDASEVFPDAFVANTFLEMFRDVCRCGITWPEIIELVDGETDGDGFPHYLPDVVWNAWDNLSLESKVVAMAIAQNLQRYSIAGEDLDY